MREVTGNRLIRRDDDWRPAPKSKRASRPGPGESQPPGLRRTTVESTTGNSVNLRERSGRRYVHRGRRTRPGSVLARHVKSRSGGRTWDYAPTGACDGNQLSHDTSRRACRVKHFQPCRHCGRTVKFLRPRRLCWTCYYTPGVKYLYPPTSKFARFGAGIGVAIFTGPRPLGEPTMASPGSEEKIAILEARAAAGQRLFHPQDEQSQTGKCPHNGAHQSATRIGTKRTQVRPASGL